MEKVDWERFDDAGVSLVPDVEKKLRLANWAGGEWYSKPGVCFDVVEEDGVAVQKKFVVTSRRLLRTLKPIIVSCEEAGRATIFLSILRSGEGFNTSYVVKEISGD